MRGIPSCELHLKADARVIGACSHVRIERLGLLEVPSQYCVRVDTQDRSTGQSANAALALADPHLGGCGQGVAYVRAVNFVEQPAAIAREHIM